MPLTQPQYATTDELVQLSLTPAAAKRFEGDAQIATLKAASSIADGYLGGQFQLPLSSWSFDLKLHVCNIAAYFLYLQYGFNPGAPVDKLVVARYEEAIEWLKGVSAETITPQVIDASNTTPPAGDFVISDAPVGFTSRGIACAVGNDDGSCW